MPGYSPSLVLFIEIVAVFVSALSGALTARRTAGYGVVGMCCLAFAAGLGGSLTRDLLLQQGTPVALTRVDYLATVLATVPLALAFGRWIESWGERVIPVLDAIGLAWFAVAGTLRALSFELEPAGAAALGMVTAVGGGVLRDLLMGRVPTVFRPGELYALAALFGITALLLLRAFGVAPFLSVSAGIGVGCAARLLSMRARIRAEALELKPKGGLV